MSISSGECWLISAPGEKGANDAWDKLNRATSNLSANSKFLIPDLKVGTLDQLVGLSDDLNKLDSTAEGVTRKLVQYFGEVLEDDRSKLAENLLVGNKDIKTYVTRFQWDGAKYPLKHSLKQHSEAIGKQITQIDNDLKSKSSTYNNLKNTLASIDRKTTGSLITKDLADIVKAEDFVLNSEYLQTLVVVVPKINCKEWEQRYSTFTSMVVPGSTRLITEEGEHALYSVTLFKKVIDEFKTIARENKFIVRDFVYDEESLKAGKSERDKLVAEKQRQYAPLIRWMKINFGEIFAAYIHVKALRVFVESVLRYGLPVNFQAAVIEPSKGSQKKLRTELNKLYIHLDGSAAGPIDTFEDSPALMSLGVNDYYPYHHMAEVYVSGQIVSADLHGDNRLSCMWSLQIGGGWRVVEGKVKGQTQTDLPGVFNKAYLAHPIDLHLATKTIQGWPRIHLQVWHHDIYGRQELYGYGSVFIPSSPGEHELNCHIWRPKGSSREEMLQRFVGGGIQVSHPSIIEDSNERIKINSVTMGTVLLRLNIITRYFDRLGIAC